MVVSGHTSRRAQAAMGYGGTHTDGAITREAFDLQATLSGGGGRLSYQLTDPAATCAGTKICCRICRGFAGGTNPETNFCPYQRQKRHPAETNLRQTFREANRETNPETNLRQIFRETNRETNPETNPETNFRQVPKPIPKRLTNFV